MLAYIVMDGSPNFSDKLIVVKMNTSVRVCMIKAQRRYADPFLSHSMEIKGSSLDILD